MNSISFGKFIKEHVGIIVADAIPGCTAELDTDYMHGVQTVYVKLGDVEVCQELDKYTDNDIDAFQHAMAKAIKSIKAKLPYEPMAMLSEIAKLRKELQALTVENAHLQSDLRAAKRESAEYWKMIEAFVKPVGAE